MSVSPPVPILIRPPEPLKEPCCVRVPDVTSIVPAEFNVPERFIVKPRVARSVPPLKTRVLEASPRLLFSETASTPLLKNVPAVYALLPLESVVTPGPLWITEITEPALLEPILVPKL